MSRNKRSSDEEPTPSAPKQALLVESLEEEIRILRCGGGRTTHTIELERQIEVLSSENKNLIWELRILRESYKELDLRFDSHKASLLARDESIKKLLDRLQRKGSDEEGQAMVQQIKILVEGNLEPECIDGCNPLLNDVILANLFKHVRRVDLLTCRRVCKKWNVSSLPFTRAAFQVTIYGSEDKRKTELTSLRYGRLPEFPIRPDCTIIDFVDVFVGNKLGIPFGNFELGSFCTTDGVGQEFLRLCGKTTKEITFVHGTHKIDNISEILRSTPNLETFKIPHCCDSMFKNISQIFSVPAENLKPQLNLLKNLSVPHINPQGLTYFKYCMPWIEELITAAPNISNLKLQGAFSSPKNLDCSAIFKLLNLIEKHGMESTIQCLDITNVMAGHLDLLRRMVTKPKGLKLKTLKFSTAICVERFEVLSVFMSTLENLVLFDDLRTFEEFPVIPHLRSLEVKMHSNRRCDFKQIFPRLKKLDIRLFTGKDGKVKEGYEFLDGSTPCLTLKKLCLHSQYLNIGTVLSLFPNLTKLKLELKMEEDNLGKIWTHMTQLQVLDLTGSVKIRTEDVSLDSLFTGIPSSTIEEIEDEVKELEEMEDDLRRETISTLMAQHCQLPSITNLTYLRTLKLSLQGEGPEKGELLCFLTDVSGYLALYSMKHINGMYIDDVTLGGWDCTQVLKAELRHGSLEYYRDLD